MSQTMSQTMALTDNVSDDVSNDVSDMCLRVVDGFLMLIFCFYFSGAAVVVVITFSFRMVHKSDDHDRGSTSNFLANFFIHFYFFVSV